ncbi:hypothetical protein Ciccas_010111, partial [Cichlidogyrus casuarinus]
MVATILGSKNIFPYLRDEEQGYQIINLPFDGNQDFKFMVFLPIERFGKVKVPMNADAYGGIVQKFEDKY